MWAEDFLKAAMAYRPKARGGSFVAHFLCCQSVELSLKGFLSLKGLTRKELKSRKFGHSLERLLDEALRRGLGGVASVGTVDLPLARMADEWYDTPEGKRFQYFRLTDAMTAFKHAPDLADLEDLAQRMQSKMLRQAVLRG